MPPERSSTFLFPARRDANTFAENVKKDTFSWQAKVVVRGTLNQREDRDEGWSVEGRIPWVDLIHTGARPKIGETWRFSLCRYDYDRQWKEPNLSTNAPYTEINFHQTEKYAPLKFIGPTPEEVRPYGLSKRPPLTTSKWWVLPIRRRRIESFRPFRSCDHLSDHGPQSTRD